MSQPQKGSRDTHSASSPGRLRDVPHLRSPCWSRLFWGSPHGWEKSKPPRRRPPASLSLQRSCGFSKGQSSSPGLNPDTSTTANIHLFATHKLVPVALELLIMGLLILSSPDWEIHRINYPQPKGIRKLRHWQRSRNHRGGKYCFKQAQSKRNKMTWCVQ